MRKNQHLWVIPLIVLIAATLACQVNVGGPPQTSQPTLAPTISLEDLQNELENTAVTQNADGSVTVSLSEDQLTALLVYQLNQSGSSILQDPQVSLENGQIEVTGALKQGVLSADAKILITVSPDPEGNPQVDIVSADFGPVPVPSGILDGFSTMIEEAFTTELGSYATGFKIDQVVIENGMLNVTGRTTNP
jgi:hypothetical protein